MKTLDMIQICKLMKLGAVAVNNQVSLQAAVEEAVHMIIGHEQIECGDYEILYAFFVGLTAHRGK